MRRISWVFNITIAAWPLLHAQDSKPAAPKPRIAVVIDDFGLTYPSNPADELWMQLPVPMTFAVMPKSPRTKLAAEQTKKAGKELIIHFPFDPFLDLDLANDGEPTEGDKLKIRSLLDDSLLSIPNAVGLNNHRSYKATQNRPLMRWFMAELKPRGMYFLDSRVAPKTVAYEESKSAGLKSAINTVFIDEAKRHDKEFCLQMMRRAASTARRTGSAIAIGHHYFHGTYECLKQTVPELQQQGFEFVFASELAE